MAHVAVPADNRNPPVDYAVAVWLGTPEAELAEGLHEGWIRAPAGVDVRSWADQRGLTMAGEALETGSVGPIVPPSLETPPAPVDVVPVAALERRIEALLRSFDPAMEATTFHSAWQEAGSDEVSRGTHLVSFVARTLNVAFDPAADLATQLANVEDAAAGFAGGAQFIRLAASSSRELERLASGDGSVRRALAEHSAWALAGNPSLARAGDVTGRYDRFDRETGEQLLSDAWVADRAKHTAWRNAHAAGRSPDIEGAGWRFVDRAAGDAVTTQLAGGGAGAMHQVIFASQQGDRITGGAGTDRIHGGHGDDILRGGSGDDLLEGGAGSDVLMGGTGRDAIDAQQGDDEIDGGAGDDELSGGSGNDELVGGRGDDRLRGGSGEDTYRFDDGDGSDTIEDDSGLIVIDDVAVSGTMLQSGEGWASSDGRFRFALEGEGSERALVVRTVASNGVEAAGAAVRIPSWTDGAFGISLATPGAEGGQASGGVEVPPETVEAGNEAPLGEGRATIPCPPDGSVFPGGTSHPRADWLADAGSDQRTAPQHGAPSLVDLRDLSSALEQWAASPPVHWEPGSGAAAGVTVHDISDALVSAQSELDGSEGAGNVLSDTGLASLSLPLRNDVRIVPPEFVLRPSP